jgi:hypothetical protein
MKDKTEKAFEEGLLEVLSSFQILELTLKVYIAASYKIIEYKLGGVIPFKYGYSDIENYPLERAIKLFTRLSNNKRLVRALNKLTPIRNEIAHRLVSYRNAEIRELLDIDLESKHISLVSTANALDEVFSLLAVELNRVVDLERSLAP